MWSALALFVLIVFVYGVVIPLIKIGVEMSPL